ncbi:peroxisomal coenzyme A diphosphatase NUDT7-like [Branchiostoma lanceolatum]|uniref:peroxisomal coenzyme A diphosphatase NUDT7-like n=1 Tax=Branchiostoma lanceolatum TaxID=7740 RepID=UPI0034528823
MLSKDIVRSRLQQYNTSDGDRYRGHPLGTAAVLVPLLYKDGDLHVLLTVRSSEVRSHKGEVCFPGGKTDPEDKDSTHTALRESEEEIKLPPEDIDVLARIPPIPAKDGMLVTPVIGFIPDSFQPTPNNEVADVFTMPLENFLQTEGHSAGDISWKGIPATLHYFQYKTNGKTFVTWGFTAMVAMMVAALIYERTPDFDIEISIDSYIESLRDARRKLYTTRNSSKM